MSHSAHHDALAEPAIRFSWHAYHMTICLHEPSKQRLNSGGECPDLICWDHYGRSLVVDFKMSAEDCNAHLNKPHVAEPHKGMGVWRVLLLSEHLNHPEVPDGWGLWVMHDGAVTELFEPERFHRLNHVGEKELLAQHAERLQKLVTPDQAQAGHKSGTKQGRSGQQIPRQAWSEIYGACVDEGGRLALEDAANIVKANSNIARKRVYDAIRSECESQGMAIDRSLGQFEDLVLAEQPEAQETY